MHDNNKLPETGQRHFLFHIFRMDKAENPMPKRKAESLLDYLKRISNSAGEKY